MKACDNNHEEICFEGRICPMCQSIEHYEREAEQLGDRIDDLLRENADLSEQLPADLDPMNPKETSQFSLSEMNKTRPLHELLGEIALLCGVPLILNTDHASGVFSVMVGVGEPFERTKGVYHGYGDLPREEAK